MTTPIGPNFSAELEAAGLLGLPFTWGEDGVYGLENLDLSDRLLVDAVVEAHNPGKPTSPTGYRLYKSVFIRRMTETEAATMESVLAGADAKLRLMFNSVEYFVSDDPLFATLMGAVSEALGDERAKELLENGKWPIRT